MVQAGIATKNIQLKVADNTTMQAYVAWPASGGPHPGLMVFQGHSGSIRTFATLLSDSRRRDM